MTTITCCKDCPNRAVGCHSSCEKYIAERAEQDQFLEDRHNEYLSNTDRGLRIDKKISERCKKEKCTRGYHSLK